MITVEEAHEAQALLSQRRAALEDSRAKALAALRQCKQAVQRARRAHEKQAALVDEKRHKVAQLRKQARQVWPAVPRTRNVRDRRPDPGPTWDLSPLSPKQRALHDQTVFELDETDEPKLNDLNADHRAAERAVEEAEAVQADIERDMETLDNQDVQAFQVAITIRQERRRLEREIAERQSQLKTIEAEDNTALKDVAPPLRPLIEKG